MAEVTLATVEEVDQRVIAITTENRALIDGLLDRVAAIEAVTPQLGKIKP